MILEFDDFKYFQSKTPLSCVYVIDKEWIPNSLNSTSKLAKKIRNFNRKNQMVIMYGNIKMVILM